MLPRRHNREMFTWLMRCTIGAGIRTRGSIDSTTAAVTFDGATMLGPEAVKRREAKNRAAHRQRLKVNRLPEYFI